MSDEDGWWRHDRFARRASNLLARARVIDAIRAFFAARSFVEGDTPALQRSPGLEPHLDAFATRLARGGESDAAMFLHTSPEFAMKKLLAAGMERMFHVGHSLRNGGRGRLD